MRCEQSSLRSLPQCWGDKSHTGHTEVQWGYMSLAKRDCWVLWSYGADTDVWTGTIKNCCGGKITGVGSWQASGIWTGRKKWWNFLGMENHRIWRPDDEKECFQGSQKTRLAVDLNCREVGNKVGNEDLNDTHLLIHLINMYWSMY